MPCACGAGLSRGSISRPSATTRQPLPLASVLLISSKRATELIEAKASPRKPKLATPSKSSRVKILLVACRAKAKDRSSLAKPMPLSVTRNSCTPPFSTSISIWLASASKLFSTNSFRTAAGLSTTSPAAIWLANLGLNK